MTVEEAHLVKRAAGGDHRAFDQLVKLHREGLVRFLCRYTGSLDLAMDAAQDCFVKAWQALPRFKGRSSFKTWLYRIALNTLRDSQRKHNPLAYNPGLEDLPLADPGPDPAEEAAQADFQRQVLARLSGLTARQQAVVNLRLVSGHSFDEVAQLLESPVGTIKATYFQAVKKLREQLREGGIHHVPA